MLYCVYLLTGCSKSHKSSLPAEKEYTKNPKVKFQIADDDEDDEAAAVDTHLLPQPTDNTAAVDTSRV